MIKLCPFGCGRIGRVYADSINVHPRAELAWVDDPIESAADETILEGMIILVSGGENS